MPRRTGARGEVEEKGGARPRSDHGLQGRGQPSEGRAASKRQAALAAGLYVVATPIGNARDITLRALDVLAAADAVACEDTRTTRRLFAIHGLTAPLIAYHEHNAARVRPRLLARLAEGAALALISDAGTPLISDPGYRLVVAALEAAIPVLAVPGPAAPIAALSVAGLPTDRFYFVGFLPARKAARRRALIEASEVPASLVILESPRRLAALLADAADLLGPREAAVARELTKRFEEVRRGSLAGLAAHYHEAGPPKGEVVVVIGPPAGTEAAVDAATLDRQLRAALASQSVRDAAALVAAATGLSRRRVYARAIELAAEG